MPRQLLTHDLHCEEGNANGRGSTDNGITVGFQACPAVADEHRAASGVTDPQLMMSAELQVVVQQETVGSRLKVIPAMED